MLKHDFGGATVTLKRDRIANLHANKNMANLSSKAQYVTKLYGSVQYFSKQRYFGNVIRRKCWLLEYSSQNGLKRYSLVNM